MIKTSIAAVALLAAPATIWAQDAEQAPSPLTVVHAGQLLAIPGDDPMTEQSILIRDGRIEAIEAGYVTPDNATIIDLSDDFVMPGMIDSHVHLQMELSPRGRLETVTLSSADRALNATRHARTTLMAGFTTVQEVGGELEASVAVRNAIRDGDIVGPRMRVSGPAVTPTGGHGDINGYSNDVMDLLSSRAACNGPADCRRAVRELVRSGADVIKITATGGVLSNTAAGVEQQFFDDELESIVEAARMMGRQVTAHAHGRSGINSFLEAGGASIEHGTYLDESSIRLFRRHDAYLVPTVLAGATVAEIAQTSDWMTPAIRAKSITVGAEMLDMIRRAHEGGVMIAFGTDSGVSNHGQNAREFQLLVEAGLTPMEALVTASINASRHLQMADDIGTIEVGKYADIIAVDGNPLEDISELMDVDFVMQGGTVHKNQ
jgi:imidazolonepropionase-like amidohydrolase